MTRFLAVAIALLLSTTRTLGMNVDAFIDEKVAPITDAIADVIFLQVNFFGTKVPLIILWILFAGIFFTIYFKGICIWGFKHAVDNIIKPADKSKGDCGDVSSFQALATALSGTIGIGSIAGVAISISIGGPGAAFWIFVGALLGMSIKFIEATLAVKYRRFNEDGSVSGGPMHYIAHGLTRKKLRWLGQPLSVLFAILCIGGGITGGNMIQINQVARQIATITGGENSFFATNAWIIGLTVAILIGLVIVGGIKGIAKVTTILTPSMCALYLLAGSVVILAHITHLGEALKAIVVQAFAPQAVAGGIFGVIVIGLRRSVQSNEAGTGAAAIVYAAAQTKEPVSQGFVALLETFLTGVLCLFTSFVIIFSGVLDTTHIGSISGIELASNAFGTVAAFLPILLSVIATLFAMSTLISWAYYGQKAWTFMFGEGKKRVLAFNLIYCIFIVIGSVMNVKSIIDITDAMMIAMCIPNVIALYILCPEIKKDLAGYCERHKLFQKKA
ncbi:MAG: alanine:cation symporter family protein [Cyanobacteria bacterium SIG27]|nr:alanine:cation symporter family protein [Cyanobacteria bacterium SIG27]